MGRRPPLRRSPRARAETALTALTPEERRVIHACFQPCASESDWQAIVRELGMSEEAVIPLANSGCEKLDTHYALVDAAEARQQGRLQ